MRQLPWLHVTTRVQAVAAVVGTVLCLYLARQLVGRPGPQQVHNKHDSSATLTTSPHTGNEAVTLLADALPPSPNHGPEISPVPLPLSPEMDVSAHNVISSAGPASWNPGPTLTGHVKGPDVDVVCAYLVYAGRRQRADNRCLLERQGAVVTLMHYGNISYCMVPKVGCTFWLNVFRFLHNDTGDQTYPSPFLIPRMTTHYGPRTHLKFFTMGPNSLPEFLPRDFRFMFVRDPWSRLWSAYLDKFFLIDFWRTDGQAIVRRRKVKDASTRCARDITFKEFVDFVVTSDPWSLNPHWRPIHYQCSPCLYRPHVIGKMETFSQDVRFVLDRLELGWVMDNYTHDAHVHGEMDILIDYNFFMLTADFFRPCSSTTDLAIRLWKTFQYNGYLPIETPFPEGQAASMNVERFKFLVHEAYRTRPVRSPHQWRQQREQAMIDAYRQIPPENIAKLQMLYRSDLELFDYDPSPPGTTNVVKPEEPSCIIK